MSKKVILCLMLLTFVNPLNLVNKPFEKTHVYTIEFDFSEPFSELFSEPFETIIFVYADRTGFAITTHRRHSVKIPLAYIISYIHRHDKELEDVVLIIHNHFACPYFSFQDRVTYRRLKHKGFKGVFALYITSTEKIRIYKAKERDKK